MCLGSREPLISNRIGHEDHEVCRSPSTERSVSALCSWGDGHHADREFTLADLVLRHFLKRQSCRRYAANGLAFVPHTCRATPWTHRIDWVCRTIERRSRYPAHRIEDHRTGAAWCTGCVNLNCNDAERVQALLRKEKALRLPHARGGGRTADSGQRETFLDTHARAFLCDGRGSIPGR
jgi:hypothetical protein